MPPPRDTVLLSTAMLPDAKWLEALKLPLRAMLGVALSSGALLLLNHIGVLDLNALHPFAWPIVLIVCAVFSIFSLVEIGDLLLLPLRERQRQSRLSARRAVRRKEQEDQRAEAEARALACLEHLSKEEIRYIANCLLEDTPSFYTYVHSPPVSMLQGKRLVWTPGGPHNQDHYPYCFHDFVWEALRARKDEFIAKDDERCRTVEANSNRRRSY